jgi:hypothetical protein
MHNSWWLNLYLQVRKHIKHKFKNALNTNNKIGSQALVYLGTAKKQWTIIWWPYLYFLFKHFTKSFFFIFLLHNFFLHFYSILPN